MHDQKRLGYPSTAWLCCCPWAASVAWRWISAEGIIILTSVSLNFLLWWKMPRVDLYIVFEAFLDFFVSCLLGDWKHSSTYLHTLFIVWLLIYKATVNVVVNLLYIYWSGEPSPKNLPKTHKTCLCNLKATYSYYGSHLNNMVLVFDIVEESWKI